ncbi:unnamed protein product [Coccothraustes coccothraustes]
MLRPARPALALKDTRPPPHARPPSRGYRAAGLGWRGVIGSLARSPARSPARAPLSRLSDAPQPREPTRDSVAGREERARGIAPRPEGCGEPGLR